MTQPLQPVSCIIPTHNRREQLAKTLGHLVQLPDRPAEVIVVDNASTDGSAEMLHDRFPGCLYHRERENMGTWARNVGARLASNPYLLMLDSDSYPTPGSIERMVRVFRTEPRLGALAFRVLLPDGTDEPGGTHCVFIGCGVGLPRSLYLELGGYPRDYFFYVEEYDLSFRILEAGYGIRFYRDISVRHDKTNPLHSAYPVLPRLVRNNLLLWWRFLPPRRAVQQSLQTLRRYWRFTRGLGSRAEFWRGLLSGPRAILRGLSSQMPLSQKTLEAIFQERFLRRQMVRLASDGCRKVAFLSMGKLFPEFLAAARHAGLQVIALFDDRVRASTARVASVPIRPQRELAAAGADAIVVASSSPGAVWQARKRATELGCPSPLVAFYDYDQYANAKE